MPPAVTTVAIILAGSGACLIAWRFGKEAGFRAAIEYLLDSEDIMAWRQAHLLRLRREQEHLNREQYERYRHGIRTGRQEADTEFEVSSTSVGAKN